MRPSELRHIFFTTCEKTKNSIVECKVNNPRIENWGIWGWMWGDFWNQLAFVIILDKNEMKIHYPSTKKITV